MQYLALQSNKENNDKREKSKFQPDEPEDDRRKRWSNEANLLLDYYNEINWLLDDDIRTTLIPRVLQLSDDQYLNLALLRFENFSRGFEEAMKRQRRFDDFPIAAKIVPAFLVEAGTLYDVLQRKISESNTSLSRPMNA